VGEDVFRTRREQQVKPVPARATAPAARVDADLIVHGDLLGARSLVVDGTVKGAVRAERLVIGPTGRVEGPVGARDIRIDGTVLGDVIGETVAIGATARVVGNVTHSTITVEPGAEIDGRRPWRPPGHVAQG
jgi:cytoskeletal protein CcmA (bactofilin family)